MGNGTKDVIIEGDHNLQLESRQVVRCCQQWERKWWERWSGRGGGRLPKANFADKKPSL